MAPQFRHGKDTVVYFNGVNMGQVLNEVGHEQSAETADKTVFGDSDRRFLAGQRVASGSFSGLHDGSTEDTDETFRTALGSSAAVVVTVGNDGGDTIGNAAFLAAGVITSLAIQSPASDVVAVNAAVQYSSEARRGYWLANLASRATATTHTAVDTLGTTGQSSTGGLTGHLHVTSATTSGTGAVELSANIQDSSDNATWADFLSFTDLNSTAPENSYERVHTTGTANRYLRGRADVQGSTAITYAIAVGLIGG